MKRIPLIIVLLTAVLLSGFKNAEAEVASTYTYIPPFLTASMPPMVMLTMARDHRLYYEAYNDASDINEDGILDIRYTPSIDYYGYFDSYKYYEYNSTGNGVFEPRGATTNKKEVPANLVGSKKYWSGDFLNYVSMTRMDCIRKVLYGGYRSTDTATETVLERAFIPQDAHSFGKEYRSIDHDGYDISKYAPLDQPTKGDRHLIATTALGPYDPAASPPTGLPILRVLTNSPMRIWDWVATEGPVVRNEVGGTVNHPGHPANHADFDTLVTQFATPERRFGTKTATNINGSGNPHNTLRQDYYLTIFSGKLVINTAGTYHFAVDGDDAVEVNISGNGVDFVVGYYGAHASCGCTTNSASIHLAAGTYDVEFRHEEASGGDNYYLHWMKPGGSWSIVPGWSAGTREGLKDLSHATYDLQSSSVLTDYTLRVKVGDPAMPEPNCKQYSNGAYKPIGLLQRHGESDKMLFGLITGSYTKNLSGGVLRQPIGSITQEINPSTGEFLYQDNNSVGGIIRTLDKLTIHGFPNVKDNFKYNEDCGWLTQHALSHYGDSVQGRCRMWGNPMAEMMYETARYFSGAGSPTPDFTYSSTNANFDDNQIGLPLATWNNPYNATNYCAQPIMLAISDIYPSYDSDQLPGSEWGTFTSSSLTGFNATTGNAVNLHVGNQLSAITSAEGISGNFFIGEKSGATSGIGACTEKTISGLHGIRGLCPEEPSKQGSYYAAAVTHFAATKDLNAADGTQSMLSYMVALSSPLPEIKISVAGQTITMVPFGKSVGGDPGSNWNINPAEGGFQPTNTIVDFFVEEINATAGSFRVNFEDVEQGADHDMDAIVRYHYEVVNNSTVTIKLDSEYAAGSIIQHLGFIISGTTADGTYLVVRDADTAAANDIDYYLDYPNIAGQALPLTSTLSFTPDTSGAAGLLKNPLWYAAKWGGFIDSNNNGIPDLQNEWDGDGNGIPDTYFFVANPTKLEEQLNKAFGDILRRTASGTAASVISQSRSGEGAVYQSIFFPEFTDNFGHTINWAGQVHALFVDAQGNIREDTNRNRRLDLVDDRIITYNETTINRYRDLDGDGILTASEMGNSTETLLSPLEINFLWSSTEWLNAISDNEIVAQRSEYNATTDNRYIFTFADKNNDMVVNGTNGEIQDFVWEPIPTPNSWLNATKDFYAYLTLYPSFSDTPTAIDNLRSDPGTFGNLLWELAKRQVDFIRGADQTNSTAIGGVAIPASRSRTYATNSSATLTWRLGDVVYSTPTVVGKPAEDYNLIYLDSTYGAFAKKYKNRRQMVYSGANDGMLHAFNGGFYNSTNKSFDLQHIDEAPFPLGMEVWAYIPYNLLPHLAWLQDRSYGNNLHVSYMDLKPRIFDARVFFDSSGNPIDEDHPDGWGTLLVAGMRFGGGEIRADVDKTGPLSFDDAEDRIMSSAYVVMDITNPEKKPTVIAEIRMPRQGFTTCYPTAMPMTTKDSTSSPAGNKPDPGLTNQWYLVFGSGPANTSGKADPLIIGKGVSEQNGQLYVLDLKALVQDKVIKTFDSTKTLTTTPAAFATTEANSFIADPIAVDLNIGDKTLGEFKSNVVYYGTASGNQTSPSGTMRRLVTENALANNTLGDMQVAWDGNSTLADVGQPVTSAPSVARDHVKNLWVYFGSGRFFNRNDIPQTKRMSFYGIKEPVLSNSMTWGQVNPADLFNSTRITLDGAGCTGGFNRACVTVRQNGLPLGNGQWDTLLSLVDAAAGWRQDFTPALERVLGQPAILSGAALFNTYMPSDDLCAFEGTSKLWAVYYRTGTAYFKPIFSGVVNDPFTTSVDLGRGMSITPNLHVGERSGSTAFVQTSTGAIETIEIDNPYATKSGTLYWRQNTD